VVVVSSSVSACTWAPLARQNSIHALSLREAHDWQCRVSCSRQQRRRISDLMLNTLLLRGLREIDSSYNSTQHQQTAQSQIYIYSSRPSIHALIYPFFTEKRQGSPASLERGGIAASRAVVAISIIAMKRTTIAHRDSFYAPTCGSQIKRSRCSC